MKKSIGIVLIALIAGIALTSFTGCNEVGSWINPVIGTWETDNLIGSTTLVVNADKSCTEVYTVAGVGSTKTGTWNTDDNIITIVWAVDDVVEYVYSFNSNNSEMTLSSPAGVVVAVYTRQ